MSKRSVEKFYYPDEPHFFRFFVNKLQRRAPLINRGYHLRLHVIDVAARRFLQHEPPQPSVIVNLGAGSDVLPWQCLTRYPEHCRDARFIDIDFPDLLAKKRQIVRATPELNSALTNVVYPEKGPVLLKSDQYVQIGCDLRQLDEIDKALATVLDVSQHRFLFVAEVSITYMETRGADAVIGWASKFNQAEFCLLEQMLPDGGDHPFAKTMLSHFDKLKTPIKSVFEYPTSLSQQRRFSSLGWTSVHVQSLWEAWTGSDYFSPEERARLNQVEPFDEWEEFALFAGHYCVVMASVSRDACIPTPPASDATVSHGASMSLKTTFQEYPRNRGKRRFAAAMELRDDIGEVFFADSFGLGTNNRLRSYDVYGPETSARQLAMRTRSGPGSRLCHSTVDLCSSKSLLVGGRASPSAPLRDCWVFDKSSHSWSKSDDLPISLYRCGTARLGQSNMTLLIGGKSGTSTLFNGCLLHCPGSGWLKCSISGVRPIPTFGSSLVSLARCSKGPVDADSSRHSLRFQGFMAGGVSEDGIVVEQVMSWSVTFQPGEMPDITFRAIHPSTQQPSAGLDAIHRFGAHAKLVDDRYLVLIGGIASHGIVSRTHEIMAFDMSEQEYSVHSTACLEGIKDGDPVPRPLLVGCSVASSEEDTLIIMGGGATCFSMGTYWNQGCYTISQFAAELTSLSPREKPRPEPWRLWETVEWAGEPRHEQANADVKSVEVPRVALESAESFAEILNASKPVIIQGQGLGSCTTNWTAAYLVDKIGPDRKVGHGVQIPSSK